MNRRKKGKVVANVMVAKAVRYGRFRSVILMVTSSWVDSNRKTKAAEYNEEKERLVVHEEANM